MNKDLQFQPSSVHGLGAGIFTRGLSAFPDPATAVWFASGRGAGYFPSCLFRGACRRACWRPRPQFILQKRGLRRHTVFAFCAAEAGFFPGYGEVPHLLVSAVLSGALHRRILAIAIPLAFVLGAHSPDGLILQLDRSALPGTGKWQWLFLIRAPSPASHPHRCRS